MSDHSAMAGACHCGNAAFCTCDHGSAREVQTPLAVTINPEARVSVALSRKLLPAAWPAGPVILPISVLNQAFVTLPLEAILLEPGSAGVALEFVNDPLSGQADDSRVLALTVDRRGPVDITIAFRLAQEKADLGGRDRFHFLFERESTQS